MPNISLILYKLYRIKDTGVKEQQPRPPPYAYPLPEPFSPAQRLNQFCRPPARQHREVPNRWDCYGQLDQASRDSGHCPDSWIPPA